MAGNGGRTPSGMHTLHLGGAVDHFYMIRLVVSIFIISFTAQASPRLMQVPAGPQRLQVAVLAAS